MIASETGGYTCTYTQSMNKQTPQTKKKVLGSSLCMNKIISAVKLWGVSQVWYILFSTRNTRWHLSGFALWFWVPPSVFMLRNGVHLVSFVKGQSNLLWWDISTVYLGDGSQKPKGITYTEGELYLGDFYLAFLLLTIYRSFSASCQASLRGGGF